MEDINIKLFWEKREELEIAIAALGSIGLIQLAGKLYARELVNAKDYHFIVGPAAALTVREKALFLVRAVSNRVRFSPDYLKIFVDVLITVPELGDIIPVLLGEQVY